MWYSELYKQYDCAHNTEYVSHNYISWSLYIIYIDRYSPRWHAHTALIALINSTPTHAIISITDTILYNNTNVKSLLKSHSNIVAHHNIYGQLYNNNIVNVRRKVGWRSVRIGNSKYYHAPVQRFRLIKSIDDTAFRKRRPSSEHSYFTWKITIIRPVWYSYHEIDKAVRLYVLEIISRYS